jgi:hypothetical protein
MIYLQAAIAIDFIHALLMVMWVFGMPLLFWHRYPKVSMAYCWFSLAFIIVNQASQYFLHECVFTTIAGWLYAHTSASVSDEWFAVRIPKAVFGFVPTHRSIKLLTEILIGVSAIGGIYSLFRRKKK